METIYAILALSVKGCKKTHIMYRANLSHSQLEKYLKLMVSKKLVERNMIGFVTTRRGLEYIEKFRELKKLMDESLNVLLKT
jgi:predicted transcriptional regulator